MPNLLSNYELFGEEEIGFWLAKYWVFELFAWVFWKICLTLFGLEFFLNVQKSLVKRTVVLLVLVVVLKVVCTYLEELWSSSHDNFVHPNFLVLTNDVEVYQASWPLETPQAVKLVQKCRTVLAASEQTSLGAATGATAMPPLFASPTNHEK